MGKKLRGMTEVVSNRNFQLNTTKGHCVFFKKGVPKMCPNLILEDAIAVGIIPTDEADMPGGEVDQRRAGGSEIVSSTRLHHGVESRSEGYCQLFEVFRFLGALVDLVILLQDTHICVLLRHHVPDLADFLNIDLISDDVGDSVDVRQTCLAAR